MNRPLTRFERDALAALRRGEPSLMIALLSAGRSRLHPEVQRELAIMMHRLGDSEYELSTQRRPRALREIAKERRTAKVHRSLLDGRRGQRMRAYEDAARELGIPERSVRRHVGNRARAFRRFSIAHGLMWPRDS
jgi:hypothetical protein